MREIKFRAWSGLEKKFRYFNGIFNSRPTVDLTHWLPLADEQQFTGLHDKNGKEIYEGDVVRVQSQYETDEPIDSSPNKVYFSDGAFRCGFHNMILGEKVCTGSSGNWNMEIIGNLYENPELLK